MPEPTMTPTGSAATAPAPQARTTIPELQAPADWHTVDFISDLHLQASEKATAAAWLRYLDTTPASALFILGDLFEVWVGDDLAIPGSFEAGCAAQLRRAAGRLALFFMAGNRDFLVGPAFLAGAGLTRLADPTVLVWAERRLLLSHGDALCLDDTEYQAFRTEVRTEAWIRDFLRRPLAERQAIARALRQQSEARKRVVPPDAWPDVDGEAARSWLSQSRATTLIHGHTHRPGRHELGEGRCRLVLSDWDAQVSPPRAEVLRLDHTGWQRVALA